MARKNIKTALAADDPDGLSYELAFAELQAIVEKMEAASSASSSDLSLEEALAAYKRGTVLLRYCERQLAAVEHELQILEDGNLTDFNR